MKIKIIQTDLFTADPKANSIQVLAHLTASKSEGNDILLFPANSLCGSYLYSSINYTDIQNNLQKYLYNCIDLPAKNPFIIGSIFPVKKDKLQNILAFIENKQIKTIISKKNLSEEEKNYCTEGNGVQVVNYKNKLLSIGFFEDYDDFIRDTDSKSVDYAFCFGSDIFSGIDSLNKRNSFIKQISNNLSCPVVFINRSGSSVPYIYTGGSIALNNRGNFSYEFPYFEEHFETIDLENLNSFKKDLISETSLQYAAIVNGIQSYFLKNNFNKVVLGLSGGIDSALVAALATAALGKKNVKGILMPSEFSTDHSIEDAITLAQNLEIEYEIIPIKPLFSLMNETLLSVFKESSFDVTEENIQSRLRGIILMAISNKTGAILLNTSNKSEIAVGYGTLYGDMCGALSILGDLYKTDVFTMAKWINKDKEIIPKNSIEKAPSAELRPDQFDSDLLPEYNILDKILNLYIDKEKSAEDIYSSGFEKEVVDRVIKMVKANEYKRRQAPPIFKLSTKTFGTDVKLPIS